MDTAIKLARTENPQTSKDAALKMVKSGALNRQEKWVYGWIDSYIRHRVVFGTYLDFTTKDIARYEGHYHKTNDICKRRFSNLERKDKIELTGERRDGCRVWRLK